MKSEALVQISEAKMIDIQTETGTQPLYITKSTRKLVHHSTFSLK